MPTGPPVGSREGSLILREKKLAELRSEVNGMTNWIRPLAPLLIMAVAGASVVGLWLFVRQPQLTRERNDMHMLTTTEALETRIPLIDAAAPEETETATFAMG